MACWLFKEEPGHYSFERLQMDGSTLWDGVRNNLALKNLRLVAPGDTILYYHTGEEKRVVGLAVCTEASMSEAGPQVRVKSIKRLKKPVSLSDIKKATEFSNSPLVRMPRLSVMPVDNVLLKYILALAETTL